MVTLAVQQGWLDSRREMVAKAIAAPEAEAAMGKAEVVTTMVLLQVIPHVSVLVYLPASSLPPLLKSSCVA